MKNASKILKTIMTKLGMEVKLEQMKLNDGVTVIEADMFEADNEAFIVTEDEQRIALPVGEYELEDGRMLVVEVEGMIKEIKEATAEEEPAVEEEIEAEATAPTQNPIAKKVIESTVRESHFSAEEIEALQKENEELKAKITELTKVDEVELSEDPKPITFNPENKVEQKAVYKFGNKGAETIEQRIFNKLFN
jgi:sucrose-6-phosphate hydrolase SacC (GH32 family)